MYNIEKIKEHSLKPHQQYFIIRWSEILENGPLNFRKFLKPCTRLLLDEFIEVIELYKTGVLKVYNIKNITKELKIALKNDKIIKSFFNNDYDFVIEKLEDLNNKLTNEKENFDVQNDKKLLKEISHVTELIKAFFNKLESKNLLEIYSKYFIENLSQDSYSYSNIDREISMLISELVYEGNSKTYLYRWGAGVFVYDKELSLEEKFIKLGQDLGKSNRRVFKCFLEANLPNIYDYLDKKDGKIILFKDKNEARIKLEELSSCQNLPPNIINYFNEDNGMKIFEIDVEAADEEAALIQAKNLLLSRISLINLDKQSKVYIPSVKNKVVLLDKRSNNMSLRLDPDDGKGIKISNFSDYLSILFLANEDEYKYLNRLMSWLRVVQDSPKETALVAMWSMMELLFVHDFSDKSYKVMSLAKPYISHYYAKNMVVKVSQILMNNETKYNQLKNNIDKKYGNVALRNNDGKIKLEYLLDYIKKNEKEVLSIYSGLIMEQRYILFINSFTTVVREKKKQTHIHLKGYIQQLEESIDNDLSRAYRIRNILAHEASVQESFFEDIYEKMVFYLQIILDDVLFTMTKQNKNTIEQLVMIKEASYNRYIKNIDSFAQEFSLEANKNAGEKVDEKLEKESLNKRLAVFKEIVNTKNLLI